MGICNIQIRSSNDRNNEEWRTKHYLITIIPPGKKIYELVLLRNNTMLRNNVKVCMVPDGRLK